MLHFLHGLVGIALLLVEFLGQWLHFFFREALEQIPSHMLLFAQFKIHRQLNPPV
jgi:hypothetical protein